MIGLQFLPSAEWFFKGLLNGSNCVWNFLSFDEIIYFELNASNRSNEKKTNVEVKRKRNHFELKQFAIVDFQLKAEKQEKRKSSKSWNDGNGKENRSKTSGCNSWRKWSRLVTLYNTNYVVNSTSFPLFNRFITDS